MVEHAENFLALYAVDMDAALEIQSPESWDSFPLFQLLNDYLRTDCEFDESGSSKSREDDDNDEWKSHSEQTHNSSKTNSAWPF